MKEIYSSGPFFFSFKTSKSGDKFTGTAIYFAKIEFEGLVDQELVLPLIDSEKEPLVMELKKLLCGGQSAGVNVSR